MKKTVSIQYMNSKRISCIRPNLSGREDPDLGCRFVSCVCLFRDSYCFFNVYLMSETRGEEHKHRMNNLSIVLRKG